MAEQRLIDADVGAALQQVGGKAMPQCMHGDALAETRCGACRAAGGATSPTMALVAIVDACVGSPIK